MKLYLRPFSSLHSRSVVVSKNVNFSVNHCLLNITFHEVGFTSLPLRYLLGISNLIRRRKTRRLISDQVLHLGALLKFKFSKKLTSSS